MVVVVLVVVLGVVLGVVVVVVVVGFEAVSTRWADGKLAGVVRVAVGTVADDSVDGSGASPAAVVGDVVGSGACPAAVVGDGAGTTAGSPPTSSATVSRGGIFAVTVVAVNRAPSRSVVISFSDSSAKRKQKTKSKSFFFPITAHFPFDNRNAETRTNGRAEEQQERTGKRGWPGVGRNGGRSINGGNPEGVGRSDGRSKTADGRNERFFFSVFSTAA